MFEKGFEWEGVNQGDPKWEPGYVHYPNRGCNGRDEIFLGKTNGRTECRLKCDYVSSCVSFEWWEQTNECHVSSSCTYEKSNINHRGGDFYVAIEGTGMPYTFEMNIYKFEHFVSKFKCYLNIFFFLIQQAHPANAQT